MSDRDFELLRELYRGELAYLDKRLSELYHMFENAGIADQTTFIVTGDHGENIGDHDLMDHQYSLHETVLRIPLVAFGPGFAKGATVETPVQLADIMPTVLDVADCQIPDTIPGHSLTTLRDLPTERPIYSEYLSPQPPIESLKQRYDCTRDVEQYDRRLRSVFLNGWKLIRGSDDSVRLYDLTSDEAETTNIAPEYPKKLESMEELLDEWANYLPSIEQESISMSQSTEHRLEDLGYLQ